MEKQLSKLRDFDKKVRLIANVDRGVEMAPFMEMGGASPSDIRGKLNGEKDMAQHVGAVKRFRSEAMS